MGGRINHVIADDGGRAKPNGGWGGVDGEKQVGGAWGLIPTGTPPVGNPQAVSEH